MITFHKLHPTKLKGDVKTIARTLNMTLEVCQRCLDLFCTVTGSGRDARYATSKPNKDKCRVHILILFVMAQGGSDHEGGEYQTHRRAT
jgi:hypothetical protein